MFVCCRRFLRAILLIRTYAFFVDNMGCSKLSLDKRGISTILILIILVAAVAVAAVGVYVVTNNGGGNNNDGTDNPDGGDKTIESKFGVGSKFYYDLGPRTSKTIGAVPSGSLVCEIIGEDSAYFYISVQNAFDTRGDPYILKMHKTNGTFDWAESKGNGKWKATVSIYEDSAEAEFGYADVFIDIEVGNYEYGKMITSMTITSGKYTRTASIDVSKNVLADPSENAARNDLGKSISYNLEMEMKGSGFEMYMDADIKTIIIGNGSGGKYRILTESKMSFSFTIDGTKKDDNTTIRVFSESASPQNFAFFEQYGISLNTLTGGMSGGSNVSYDLNGKQVDAKKYTATVDGASVIAYFSADGKVLYGLETISNSAGSFMNISIRCIESTL